MNLSRRSVIRIGAAVAVVSTAAAAEVLFNITARVHGTLRRQFGEAVTGSEATRSFVADYVRLFGDLSFGPFLKVSEDVFETDVVTRFLQSTTAHAHLTRGAPLAYVELYHPYLAPCQSQLAVEFPDDQPLLETATPPASASPPV
jgi:hypothetical protein